MGVRCARQNRFDMQVSMAGVCLAVLLTISFAQGPLAVPGHPSPPGLSIKTALLPPRGASSDGARLKVEATGGCYHWRSDRPDLLSVEEPQSGCRSTAVLQSRAVDVTGPEKIVVRAQDAAATQVELRCEVYIARVARLEVETHVRQIVVADVTEVEVRAYDSQGNAFSSLEGLEFQWLVLASQGQRQGSASLPLRLQAPEQAILGASAARLAMAGRGAQSDVASVEGVVVGRARIAAKLAGPGGETVARGTEITVCEVAALTPPKVLLPLGGELQLRLQVATSKDHRVEQQPDSALFTWHMEPLEGGAAVLSVDESGRVLARSMGSSRVMVEDSRVGVVCGQSVVHVVKPVDWRILPVSLEGTGGGAGSGQQQFKALLSDDTSQLVPQLGWTFMRGLTYGLKLELLDAAGQVIYIPNNLRVDFDCTTSSGVDCPFSRVWATPTGAVVVVAAESLGSGDIHFRNAVIGGGGQRLGLDLKQPFIVVEPLRLETPVPIVLPPQHMHQLRIVGGTGRYSFSLEGEHASHMGTVSAAGLLSTFDTVGELNVLVSDASGAAITIPVVVGRPQSVVLRPDSTHIELPSRVAQGSMPQEAVSYVPVIARAAAGRHGVLDFSDCPKLTLVQLASSDVAVAQVYAANSAPGDGACVLARVAPHSLGSFVLSASFRDPQGQTFAASEQFRVNTALELSFMHPGSPELHTAEGVVLLAPCSVTNLVLSGGPDASGYGGSRLQARIATNLGTSSMRFLQTSERAFEVLCLSTTQDPVELLVEMRREGATDVESHARAWVWCTVPKTAHLLAVSPAASASTKPGSSWGVKRGEAYTFSARYMDAKGSQIVTSSEYAPTWALQKSATDLTHMDELSKDTVRITIPGNAAIGNIVSLIADPPSLNAQRCASVFAIDPALQPAMESGVSLLMRTAILAATLYLQVADDLVVRWPGYPSRSLHFAFPSQSTVFFSVTGGSGQPALTASDPTVATSHADGNNLRLQCIKQGSVRATIEDAGMLGGHQEELDITFLLPGQIGLRVLREDSSSELSGMTKMILLGSRHPIATSVLDVDGNVLSEVASTLQVKVTSSDSRLVVEQDPGGHWSVRGLGAGVFELHAASSLHNMALASMPLRVEVLKPLELRPAQAVVLPGQTFELNLGLSDKAACVNYRSSDEYFVTVRPALAQQDGLAAAVQPGRASLVAELVDCTSGVVITSASSDVVVVVPDQLSIGQVEGSQAAAGPLLLSRGAGPLRMAAIMSGGGYELTLPLLTAPDGSIGHSGRGHACRFVWSTEPAVGFSLEPVGSLDLLGAAVVDVSAAEGADSAVLLSVEVQCPAHCTTNCVLKAERHLSAVRPLALTRPATHTSMAGAVTLHVPVHGQVPLVFSEPHDRLDIKVAGGTLRSVASLDFGSGSGQGSVVLRAGAEEGEMLIVARDIARSERHGCVLDGADGSYASKSCIQLVITVVVHTPRFAWLSPPAARMLLHSQVECQVKLSDSQGVELVLPSNYAVEHSISHASVLTSEKILRDQEQVLRLHGARVGCASVNVVVKMLGSQTQWSLGAVEFICVARGAILGGPPVNVHLGAQLHLSIDSLLLGPLRPKPRISFRLVPPCGEPVFIGALGPQLAADLTALLQLPPGAVHYVTSRWAEQENRDEGRCVVSPVEVDVDVDMTLASPLLDLPALAEVLWNHPALRSASPLLRHLDLSFGFRVVDICAAGGDCQEARSAKQFCGVRDGWSSSEPQALSIDKLGSALAMGPGTADLQLCVGGVSAAVQVNTVLAARVGFEPMMGGAMVLPRGERPLTITNSGGEALVVPLRFFARSGTVDEELRSGPFVSQRVPFHCAPAEASLLDFFEFRAWPSASSAAPAEPSLLPRGEGQPQAACVLKPRRPDARRWASLLPQRTFTLVVSSGDESWASPEVWPFVPQFFAVDKAGQEVAPGGVCAVLTMAEPSSTIWVWTGGHPMEATWIQHLLQPHNHGVTMQTVAPTGTPMVSITLTWDLSLPVGGVKDMRLQIESRASDQVEDCIVRIDSTRFAVLSSRRPGSFWVSVILAVLLAGITLRCFLWRGSAVRISDRGTFEPSLAPPRGMMTPMASAPPASNNLGSGAFRRLPAAR